MSKFKGATEIDWEETVDFVLSRDTWWRYYVWTWDKRLKDAEKTRAWVSITAMLLQLVDLYLVNPNRRHIVSQQNLHACSNLHNKTLRSGWWQDAVKKLVFRNQVENVPHLATLASVLNTQPITRYHVRNMANTFCRLCTMTQPDTMDQLLRDADNIWGSWLYMQLEIMGQDKEAAVLSASHLGKAMGIAFALQSLQHARHTHCTMVPRALMNQHGVELEHWVQRKYTPGMAAVCESLMSVMVNEMMLARDSAVPLGWRGGLKHRQVVLQLPLSDLEAWMKLCVFHKFNLCPDAQEEVEMEQRYQFYRRGRLLWKRYTLRTYLGSA
eukprot:TRINITY_DN5357_c0_g1_i1.p2 TRINITY_DN5357_c0_g1~~TRINITY_DN5357_c0_g1_i1.p2  ORF type:complete len:326 (+),score=129.05 TRINITY_DN5357_c0_g1_i1:477-1454(+)